MKAPHIKLRKSVRLVTVMETAASLYALHRDRVLQMRQKGCAYVLHNAINLSDATQRGGGGGERGPALFSCRDGYLIWLVCMSIMGGREKKPAGFLCLSLYYQQGDERGGKRTPVNKIALQGWRDSPSHFGPTNRVRVTTVAIKVGWKGGGEEGQTTIKVRRDCVGGVADLEEECTIMWEGVAFPLSPPDHSRTHSQKLPPICAGRGEAT